MSTYQVSDKSVKHSLNLTNFAITFGMVFYSIFGQPVGSSLFTGFMRKLGTNDLVYSVVMALPVLGGVSQILGSYFLERTGKRRFLFLASGFVHRLFWIPVALIPLFIVSDMHQAIIISITILITVSSVAYSVNTVVFNSWMGDLVPQEIAGRFFSTRSLISNISGGIAALLVGAFIDRVNNLNGFAIIFILGVLFGMVEIITFFRVKNPPMTLSESKPSLVHIIIEPFKNKNYMKFVAFATIFMFGVNFAVPFFNVYMIEKLKMSYFIIAMANSVTYSIGAVVFVRKWGALADRFGNKPVVFCCALGVAIVPIIWLFAAPGHILMTYVANFVAGVAWSGYYVAIFNQSVWLAPEKNRSAYIA
ncbi:MAG TPA: MFS transporter, partial [Clostridia bacterium]|nr:MFS transporter [Clostridia bacterium]